MTSEVVALNSDAVVLAADRALTLTAPSGSSKVYPAISKIFRVCQAPPLGAMIYGSPRIAGVPWATLFRLYSETDPDVSTVLAFARGFDEWIDETQAIPSQMRLRAWRTALTGVVQRCLADARTFVATRTDFNATVKASALVLRRSLQAAPPLRGFDEADVEAQVQRQVEGNRTDYDLVIDELLQGKAGIDARTRRLLQEVLAESTCRDYPSMSTSGIVFAGLGRRETSPAYATLTYTLERDVIRRSAIHTPGEVDAKKRRLLPFGQTDEVAAFLDGVHPRLLDALDVKWQALNSTVADLVPEVAEACLQNVTGSLELELTADQRSKLKREFEGMVKRIWDVNYGTFRQSITHDPDGRFRRRIDRTVASLPSQTLAEVAEDLVRLTITRQKVWPDDVETVGGDVDVAVMSKYDGFVWSSRSNQA